MPVSEWHLGWQRRFPSECREKRFEIEEEASASSERVTQERPQRRTRFADVYLPGSNTVLELQHSRIDKKEVQSRGEDYVARKNCRLIWLVDGKAVKVHRMYLKNSVLLVLDRDNRWMYESFSGDIRGCEHVYMTLDCPRTREVGEVGGGQEDEVVRFRPDDVRSGMVEVRSAKITEKSFREAIQSVDGGLEDLFAFDAEPMPQCKLYLNQRGAGCGKTYESVKMALDVATHDPTIDDRIVSPRFREKTCFLYLTKQHTAKNVIREEFESQLATRPDLSADKRCVGRQYRFTIVDAATSEDDPGFRRIEVVIGTIDSYFYAMGNKAEAKQLPGDFFSNLRETILAGHKEYDVEGRVKYGGGVVRHNRRCLIVVDEAQDLPPEYVEALAVIQRGTHADLFVIGDKLQSIWGSDNVFTRLESESLPHACVEFDMGSNVVRRFRRPGLMSGVNKIVRFDDYGLPEIRAIGNGYDESGVDTVDAVEQERQDPSIVWFRQMNFANPRANHAKQKQLIGSLLQTVDGDSRRLRLMPHNFMFIFPFMKGNSLACYLESALQTYWSERFMNDREYRETVLEKHEPYWSERMADYDPQFFQHAVLHASDENCPINLDESRWASRLLTIHASKGQGCEVVFFMNASEFALKSFSAGRVDLQYESLLHVAVTRQKLKLYVGITDVSSGDDTDDVYNRFSALAHIRRDINDENEEVQGKIRSATIKVADVTGFVDSDRAWSERLRETHLGVVFDDLAEMRERTMMSEPRGGVASSLVDEFRDTAFQNCRHSEILYGEKEEAEAYADNPVVDWGHHIVRAVVMRHALMRNIASDNTARMDDKRDFKQIVAQMLTFARAKPTAYNVTAYFRELKRISEEKAKRSAEAVSKFTDDDDALSSATKSATQQQTTDTLPVLDLPSHRDTKYSGALIRIVRNLQARVLSSSSHHRPYCPRQENERSTNSSSSVIPSDLCPIESVVLEHFLQVCDNGQHLDITAMKLYEILHSVHCNEEIMRSRRVSDNVRLALREVGRPSRGSVNDKTASAIRQSLLVHYDALHRVRESMYAKFIRHLRDTLEDRSPVAYNVNHALTFVGRSSDDFRAYARVPFVATTRHNVVLIFLHPTFDALNQRSVCTSALFSTFIAQNPPERSANHNRFSEGGKRAKAVHACVMSFSLDEPYWMRLNQAFPESAVIRRCIRDAACTRLESTNRACVKKFEERLAALAGDPVGAIESTRTLLCETYKNTPSYVREFLNRAEEKLAEEDERAPDPYAVVNKHEMDRFARRRVEKWLALVR